MQAVSREGVNKDLRYLRAVLRQGLEERAISTLPFKVQMLRTTRKLPSILDADELRHLFDTARLRLKPLLITAAMTGLRNSELRSLWWEDVDFDNRTLTVRAKPEIAFSPKSHAERELPLNSKVAEVLEEQRARLRHASHRDFVFQSHRCGMRVGEYVVLAERHYYVSRSHNWVQALGGLLPVPEGALVFYLNRTSTDRAAGFGASAKHSLGRRIMGQQIAALFEKARAEAAGD